MEGLNTRKIKPFEKCPDGHTFNTQFYKETCPYCGKKVNLTIKEQPTPEELKESAIIEAKKSWVCGWLVCIIGLNKGRSYKICAGRNFIGGSSSMDILILGDRRIEWHNHAIIAYDERGRITNLLPGESRGMIYLNDNAIFEQRELQPFDRIELGNSVFMYVQLCGEEFNWADTEKMQPPNAATVVLHRDKVAFKRAKPRKLKPIETCPDGHRYNSDRHGEICPTCGKKLDPPKPESLTLEELRELTHVDKKDWVCGWLVCISGPNRGDDYEIRAGRNFIGGDSRMDIHITGDKLIEQHNHAVITYEEYKRATMLQPGNSRGMVYIQGDAIHKSKELEPLDKIEIGESTFIFVPFCGKEFDWSVNEQESENCKNEVRQYAARG